MFAMPRVLKFIAEVWIFTHILCSYVTLWSKLLYKKLGHNCLQTLVPSTSTAFTPKARLGC